MIRASVNDKLEMFCVFYVDMESSTYNMARLRPEEYSVYYSAFYDTLSDIAQKFGGRVIKHVGDALIIYFPSTSDPQDGAAFRATLDCGMAMVEAQSALDSAFREKNLPQLFYRISADYGRMEPIETRTSTLDWIGPSMNMVAKMNRIARTNTMVIGGDLHQIISKLCFHEYLTEFVGELNIGIKQKYPVYSVVKKRLANTTSSALTGNIAASTIRILRNCRPESTTVVSGMPNIVIVDDETDILEVLKHYLLGQPVNVEVFADPILLLARLAQVGPSYYDLAILDVRMPKLSGFQVHQLLTALKPNIKTLFVSALDYAGEVLTGLRGIDKEVDFIRKPVSREQFVCAVTKKISMAA